MIDRKESENRPQSLPRWLGVFGDFMSILVCFFVLLLSMSSMDSKKVEDALGSLAGAFSVLEGGAKLQINRQMHKEDIILEKNAKAPNAKQIKRVITTLNEANQNGDFHRINLDEAQNGFIIHLPANIFFEPSSAVIKNSDALLFLRRIALIVKKMPENVMVNAIGYTDDNLPNKDSKYKNNWELSSARAISVVQELIKANVSPKRLVASGRARFNPIASNQTEKGRAKNRRVDLHFYSSDKNYENSIRKSILDIKED